MKKTITLILAMLLLSAATFAKTAVVYFSWSGTTERMAKMIAEETDGDLFKLELAKPYPSNYRELCDVVQKELDNNIVRELKSIPNLSSYDTIFVGTPVWCHTAAQPVQTFLNESQRTLRGKTVVPFCTYYSTYRDETLARIVELSSQSKHLDGMGTTNPKKDEVSAWLKRIGAVR